MTNNTSKEMITDNKRLFHRRKLQRVLTPLVLLLLLLPAKTTTTTFVAAAAAAIDEESSTTTSISSTNSSSRISRDVRGATIPGLFWKTSKSRYVVDIDWLFKGKNLKSRIGDAMKFFFRGGVKDFWDSTWALYGRRSRRNKESSSTTATTTTTIYDARRKEREEGLSKSDFFNKYGFVLLEHQSKMDADGWLKSDREINELLNAYNSIDDTDTDTNSTSSSRMEYDRIMDDFRNGDTPVKSIYANEVVDLVKSIVPNVRSVMPPARGIRRYVTRTNLNKAPARQVHNDYGLNFDEIVDRNPFFDFKSQRTMYEETQSDEYMLINFWRPIKPMNATASRPLRSFPLCFLDASTLGADDFVYVDYKSLGLITALKENNDEHAFYYYPDMTTDEVVVFKQFHQVRNEPIARMPTFHTAFPDPAADETTEDRISFEYRVGLLI